MFPSFHCLANQPPYIVQKRPSPDCFCSFCIFVSLMLAVCAAYFTAGCFIFVPPPCAFPSDVHIARSRAMYVVLLFSCFWNRSLWFRIALIHIYMHSRRHPPHQECVSEFICFITSEASDKCKQEKRKTINGEDLLWAMSTLGFDKYVDPLKIYLAKCTWRALRRSVSLSFGG